MGAKCITHTQYSPATACRSQLIWKAAVLPSAFWCGLKLLANRRRRNVGPFDGGQLWQQVGFRRDEGDASVALDDFLGFEDIEHRLEDFPVFANFLQGLT